MENNAGVKRIFDYIAGWIETLDIMIFDPELAADIRAALKENDRSDTVTLDELKKELGL